MSRINSIEVRPLKIVPGVGEMIEFYEPQPSSETMLVHVPPKTVNQLFSHHTHTDQLIVIKGSCILVVLHNRQYQYIALSENQPQLLKIPPNIPHAPINMSSESCICVNALIRHAPAHKKDYSPLNWPFPYDLTAAQAALEELEKNALPELWQ